MRGARGTAGLEGLQQLQARRGISVYGVDSETCTEVHGVQARCGISVHGARSRERVREYTAYRRGADVRRSVRPQDRAVRSAVVRRAGRLIGGLRGLCAAGSLMRAWSRVHPIFAVAEGVLGGCACNGAAENARPGGRTLPP